jgi:putative ABC transport system permease protein
MGVLERRREIGILRSMGATGRKVAQVFWTEGVGLGIVSWVIAVVIGIPAAYGFVQVLGAVLLKSPFVFNPLSVLAMLVFIVAVASLATIGPVWSASRVRIAETLRYE